MWFENIVTSCPNSLIDVQSSSLTVVNLPSSPRSPQGLSDAELFEARMKTIITIQDWLYAPISVSSILQKAYSDKYTSATDLPLYQQQQ